MNLYNLHYKADNQIIDKKNITKKEIDEILNTLEKVYESDLRITKIKQRDEEEER